MRIKIIEVTNQFNFGKFMLLQMDEEWNRRSKLVEGYLEQLGTLKQQTIPLLREIGWNRDNVIVFDLQTQEGAAFFRGGLAKNDLEKHKIWVCPMYEPFLAWLYHPDRRNLDIMLLPDIVELSEEATREHTALHGHRRPGPKKGK